MQQRLRRDAADIEAGAAEGLVLLDDRGFQAQLRRADRAHIAARAGADHDDIIGSHDERTPHHSPCPASTSLSVSSQKTWMAGTYASEATPFFERLCPATTARITNPAPAAPDPPERPSPAPGTSPPRGRPRRGDRRTARDTSSAAPRSCRRSPPAAPGSCACRECPTAAR